MASGCCRGTTGCFFPEAHSASSSVILRCALFLARLEGWRRHDLGPSPFETPPTASHLRVTGSGAVLYSPAMPESAAQRRRIHRLRAVRSAQAHRRGRLRLRARARRNLRLQGPALLRPRLFRAEGRARQDRRRDLEDDLRPHADEARRGHGGHRHRAGSPPIRTGRATRSSSRRWSRPASAR